MNSIRQFLFCIIFFGLASFNLAAQQRVNLIENAGFNVDQSIWEFNPNALGLDPVILEGGGLDGTNALHTGFVIEASQTLDLLEIGYTPEYLDSSPIIRFAYYVKGSGPVSYTHLTLPTILLV